MHLPNYSLNTPLENSLRPIANIGRIDLLDVLRGFAICGILLANLPFFMGYYVLTTQQQLMLPFASANKIVIFFIHFLIEGKLYSLFSLLFGIGFAIQLNGAQEKGKSFLPLYLRRLVVLFLIGLLHLILIWTGDILTSYALTGFVLLLFRKKSDLVLLRWAIVLLLLPVVQYGLVMATGGKLHPGTLFSIGGGYFSHHLGLNKLGNRLTLLQGDYLLMIKSNIVSACYRFSDLLYTGRFFKILALFLLGFYIGRKQLIRHIEMHRLLLKKILLYGMLIGIPANLALAYLMEVSTDYPPSLSGLLQSVVYAVGVVPLSFVYVAFIISMWQNPTWQNKLSFFAPIGRMALSNYLLQSLICIFIFNGIGLGLMGKIGPFIALGIAAIIILFQFIFSHWWMNRYRFGPAEWLWRSLTYGRWQKFKLAPAQIEQR